MKLSYILRKKQYSGSTGILSRYLRVGYAMPLLASLFVACPDLALANEKVEKIKFQREKVDKLEVTVDDLANNIADLENDLDDAERNKLDWENLKDAAIIACDGAKLAIDKDVIKDLNDAGKDYVDAFNDVEKQEEEVAKERVKLQNEINEALANPDKDNQKKIEKAQEDLAKELRKLEEEREILDMAKAAFLQNNAEYQAAFDALDRECALVEEYTENEEEAALEEVKIAEELAELEQELEETEQELVEAELGLAALENNVELDNVAESFKNTLATVQIRLAETSLQSVRGHLASIRHRVPAGVPVELSSTEIDDNLPLGQYRDSDEKGGMHDEKGGIYDEKSASYASSYSTVDFPASANTPSVGAFDIWGGLHTSLSNAGAVSSVSFPRSEYDLLAYGGTLGVDYNLNINHVFGISFIAQKAKLDSGTGDADIETMSLVASYSFVKHINKKNMLYLEALFGYAENDIETKNINQAGGETESSYHFVEINIGYEMSSSESGLRHGPFASYFYLDGETEDYLAVGPIVAYYFDDSVFKSSRAKLGWNLAYDLELGDHGSILTPYISVAGAYESESEYYAEYSSLLAGISYRYQKLKISLEHTIESDFDDLDYQKTSFDLAIDF